MDKDAENYQLFLETGKDSYFADIVLKYKDGLLLYLNSFTNNLSLAEDCVQDTFIKLAIKKPKFREKSTFKTWLYAIGRNVTLDTLRKLRHHASLDEISELADMQDLEQDYLIEEQKIAVHRAIRNLKQDYQQVIYLVYFENFTNDETVHGN